MKVISKYKLLCQSQQGCLFYKKGQLYFSDALDQAPAQICKLKTDFVNGLLFRMRLTERMLRLEPRFAVPYCDGFLLSWNTGIYFVDLQTRQLKKLCTYRPGMNNPLSIVGLKDIPGFADGYVYGDYWANPKKEAVGIHRVEETGVKCVYSFAPGQVLHVHGITPDPKTGRVLICTGDTDAESAIWQATADFTVVTPMVIGSQSCRTCAAYVTDQGILYATDTPLADNGIYIYDEVGKQTRKIYEMPGPCIYAKRIQRKDRTDLFVFATSVEPDSKLPYWRYRWTYRLGAGVKSRWVHIVVGNPEEGFRTVFRFKKDGLPMLLFQFGNCAFPDTLPDTPLLCTPQSVKHYDGKTVQIELGE